MLVIRQKKILKFSEIANTLQGPSQMDLGHHYSLYLFKKSKSADTNKKSENVNFVKDFHCFELMGFAHVCFLPFEFSKAS